MAELKDKKPHFSSSQINMLSRCGESWRRRYLENERLPPVISMLKGTAMHHGAETNFRQKMTTGRDLPKAEIVEASVSKFEESYKDEIALTSDETKTGKKALLDTLTKEVVQLATVHAEQQAPEYQPISVEQEFRVEIDGCTHDLYGFIDLIDDRQRVVDFKTSKAKPKKGTEVESLQLTAYAAHQMTKGVYPVDVRLDYLTLSKRGVTRTALDSSRDLQDIDALGRRVDMAAKMVKSGVFMPALPGSWWCSATWCGYWRTCPYVNSQRSGSPKLVELK